MAIPEILFDSVIGPFLKLRNGPITKELKATPSGTVAFGGQILNTVAEESFAATNARFFGELGLPATQGWTDSATGSATIDLVDDNVLGTTKQVVRHNDDVTDGAITSSLALTAQNWTDINAFGASFSGTSRLDTVNGALGFFVGLQANAAENPLATGNRRYGITFNDNGGNLRVTEPGGTTVTFDGTGGNPLIAFDEWVSWECVVLAGLGAAQFYVNGVLTTFAPTFIVNSGGLGTKVSVGSGSTSGASRVAYHDNFGITVYEESETKTLAAATMDADVAQVFIPEGRRAYSVILPDGNPRSIGAQLKIAANNLFGTVKLTNQNTAVPEILYNGLRTLTLTVTVKDTFRGINTVNNGNVYLGFGVGIFTDTNGDLIFVNYPNTRDDGTPSNILGTDADGNLISGPNEIIHVGGNFVDTTDQSIVVSNTPQVATFNTNSLIVGISHTVGSSIFTINTSGIYRIVVAPQLGQGTGAATVEFWLRKNGVDIANSNVQVSISSNSQALPLLRWKESFVATDIFEVVWASNSMNSRLDNIVSSYGGPNIPSIMLGVTQVGS